jgi:hypothetical protein
MRDWKNRLRPLYYAARGLWYRGRRRHCALCRGSFRGFLEKGEPPRPEAMCPRCLSLERHRLLWLFLSREWHLGSRPGSRSGGAPSALLHFAPEAGIRKKLERLPGLRYVTADIVPGRGLAAMNITRLGLRSGAFDAVLCCHVLEHIPDDAAAMRELFRMLRPGGTAILQVPLRGDDTDEDPAVTSPAERLRRFGQDDHVRIYGRADFARRLEDAGFRVRIVSGTEGLTAAEIERGRLLEGDPEDAGDVIFLATRAED